MSEEAWEIEEWPRGMPMWYFRWFRHPGGTVALYRALVVLIKEKDTEIAHLKKELQLQTCWKEIAQAEAARLQKLIK